jgi:type IV secretory pathway TraG/TraD family ATPase VirD4
MRKFILRYLLVIATITSVSMTDTGPVQAQQQSADYSIPSWLQPYQQQLWNPQGIVTLAFLGLGCFLMMSGDNSHKRGRMASARWAGGREKLAARKVAIKQINERRRDGLTTWINTPLIHPLKQPLQSQGKIVKRYHISPQSHTIFIPDGQRGTMVCGAPGSGKTFSVIDPMIRSVIDQGFPICLYDFKFPGGQAEIHAAYARSKGYDVQIFAPGFEGTESCNLLDFCDRQMMPKQQAKLPRCSIAISVSMAVRVVKTPSSSFLATN